MWRAPGSDHALNPSQSGLVSGLTEAGLSALRPVFEAWERSSYSRVVISCEELSTLSPGQVQMLRGLTNGAPVSIVFYPRRWPELLASEWQEYVKQGKTLQLPEVIVHNLRNPERSRIINPDLFLKPYEAVFGRAALKLIPYSVITDCGGDIFDEFAKHFLQPAMVARPRQRIVNPSFPAPKIELLRLFNLPRPGSRREPHTAHAALSRVAAQPVAGDQDDRLPQHFRENHCFGGR